MGFKLGNTNIGELYVGSQRIAQAYFGSSLVYQLVTPPTFDGYVFKVHRHDDSSSQVSCQGMKMDNTTITSNDIYLARLETQDGTWQTMTSEEIAGACNESGQMIMWGKGYEMWINKNDSMSQFQFHTFEYFQPESDWDVYIYTYTGDTISDSPLWSGSLNGVVENVWYYIDNTGAGTV